MGGKISGKVSSRFLLQMGRTLRNSHLRWCRQFVFLRTSHKNKSILMFPSNPQAQWFPKCAPPTSRDPRPVPRDPWIHFCNGYFGVHLLFKLRE